MIKILDSILTKEECSELIKIGSDSMRQATTLGKVVDGYRTADNSWIYDTTELTQKIKNLIGVFKIVFFIKKFAYNPGTIYAEKNGKNSKKRFLGSMSRS